MSTINPTSYLIEYVALQEGLVEALLSECTYGIDSFLLNLPRQGDIHFRGEKWSYQKHGGGVTFIKQNPRIIVDVHEHFEEPNLFDGWRLRTYFGSLGKQGTKIVTMATGTKGIPLSENIEKWLLKLLKDETIERVGDSYRLVN